MTTGMTEDGQRNMAEWFEGSGVRWLRRSVAQVRVSRCSGDFSEYQLLAATVLGVPVLGATLLLARGADAQTCPSSAELTKGMQLPLAAVRFLADDRLEGRRAGTPGEQCAGDYIAREFERIGLRPAGEQGYFQSLPLASALNPHDAGGTGRNVIAALDGADATLQARMDRHRRPLRSSWQRRSRLADPGDA